MSDQTRRGENAPPFDRAPSTAQRIYRRLLILYPAEFRGRFGGEMVQVFLDRSREELRRGGASGMLGLWLHSLADLAVTAPTEHLDVLRQDLRQGVRLLGRSPGFTAIAVSSLALGIGLNTAVFSVVDAVLGRPLPFAETDRLVDVSEVPPGGVRFAVAPATFVDWREQNRTFEDMAAISSPILTLSGVEEPRRLRANRVSASFFPLLGVRPLLGRALLAEEDAPGNYGVAVLSHELWQSQFGGDREVLGRTLTLDDEPYVVVGVMPRGFRFFSQPWDPEAADIWLPYPFHGDPPSQRKIHRLTAIGRLKPEVSVDEAQADMDRIAQGLARAHPDSNEGWGVRLTPLQDHLVDDVRTPLLLLMGAVGVVLLIACGNIANLLLARAADRRHELAVRDVLGAGRVRLVRQLLTESLLLALAGGVAGLLLGFGGQRALVALAPGSIPRLDEAALDMRVFGFTMAVAVLTGLLAGLAAALESSRASLPEWLKEGARPGTAGRRPRRLRSTLVAVEIAMALVLLVGAGLLIQSLLHYQRVARGFDVEKVLAMQVVLPRARYAEPRGTAGGDVAEGMKVWRVRPAQTAFVEGVVERAAGLPGVQAAGAVNYLPVGRVSKGLSFAVEGRPDLDPEPVAWYRTVTPGYLRAMGIPLLRGRQFTEADTDHSPEVVIVSEAIASQYWPDEDPVGHHVRVRDGEIDEERALEIVGVAGNTRQNIQNALSLGRWGRLEQVLYYPYRQQPQAYVDYQIYSRMRVSFVVRTRSDPSDVAPALRAAVKELDPDQPIEAITTFERFLADADGEYRFYLLLMSLFAALAVALAASGVYGVMRHTVTRRRHEIAIRMALGASATDVLKLVLPREWAARSYSCRMAAIGSTFVALRAGR